MPLPDSSFSNCSLLTKSRRTWSCRSCFQSMRTAPRMWFFSYAAVSSSTSTSTTFGSSRCCSTQSASTSTLLLGIAVLLDCSGLAGRCDVAGDRASEKPGQSQVDLTAEAEVERRVEERGDERGGRAHHPQRRDAAEVAGRGDGGEHQPDALGEARRRRRLELARRPQPRAEHRAVEQAVRRETQAADGADGEHHRLGGDEPARGGQQHDGEHDGRERGTETRTARVDVQEGKLLNGTGRTGDVRSGGQTQAGRYAAQVDRAPAPQPDFHNETLRKRCLRPQ